MPIGELGAGEETKKAVLSLIDLAQQVVDESEAGGSEGMLWSRAADHTTHRKKPSLLRHVTSSTRQNLYSLPSARDPRLSFTQYISL